MSGAEIGLTLQGIEGAARALGQLATIDLEDLAFNVAALLESSTKERIATEKSSPEGAAWAPWSTSHAASRKASHSLLVEGNHLLTSFENYSVGLTARIGSNLVYAAIHQFGGKAGRGRKVTIPARPYLGLSADDRSAIEALITDTLEGRLQ